MGLDYNLLFRWFVGLSVDEPVWDATATLTYRPFAVPSSIERRNDPSSAP